MLIHFINGLVQDCSNSSALAMELLAAISLMDIFKYILMNEKFCFSIQISLKFVPNGLIDQLWLR